MSELKREEKLKKIGQFCNGRGCFRCPLYIPDSTCSNRDRWTDRLLEYSCRIIDYEEELRQDLKKEEAKNRLQQAEEQLGFKFNMLQRDEVAEKAMNDLMGEGYPASKEEIKAALSKSQTAKADHGKEELTLVPRRIIHDICAIRMYGNKKYPEGGPDNWKQVEIERYRNAAYRHFLAYLDDPQGKDKESGFPHLWHLACNIAFLCEMEDKNEQTR